MALKSLSSKPRSDKEPTLDEMEVLLVNNESFEQIESYINRFNPIRTMKMERMEIRHSAILGWLLDPQETHALGDHFLKSFLAEAFRGRMTLGRSTSLAIIKSDLRDALVRIEWKNIDIFITCPKNGWTFVIENKFDSKQHSAQLERYKSTIQQSNLGFERKSINLNPKEDAFDGYIFLTLFEEEPAEIDYAPINYQAICEILDRLLARPTLPIAHEVHIFLTHYLEILKDATGMNEQLNEMEKLARQLYSDHRKVIDFIVEHGSSSDFSTASRTLFGENPVSMQNYKIDNNNYVFGGLSAYALSFLPEAWFSALGGNKYIWEGCEKWWVGFPLIVFFHVSTDNYGVGGKLRIYAEVGPIFDAEIRKQLIDDIQTIAAEDPRLKIKFQNNASSAGKRYSKFLKKDAVKIEDMNDSDAIATAMKSLLKQSIPELSAVAAVLPNYIQCAKPK
jgi:hypothetical protein